MSLESTSHLCHLPSELYSHILDQVPEQYLQRTAFALRLALPRAPIAQYHLFTCIRLTRAEQVIQLSRRLREVPEYYSQSATFSLETWTVDADAAINLIRTLPRLKSLTLFIGPNWAPEHLEELLQKPIEALKNVSFRFRPYVQKATYYQFLKGAYFDSTVLTLSQWPPSGLPSLSIVQDPLDPSIAPVQKFAQPLVFFRLEPFSCMSISPYAQDIEHFRLRIPSRQIARFLYTQPGAFPRLTLLDLSTCNVGESDVEQLLGRLSGLKHLIADNCSLLRGEGDWAAFGKTCALAGVKRAREREKKLKAHLELVHAQQAAQARGIAVQDALLRVDQGSSRPRRGRRGIANSTITLRERQAEIPVALNPLLDIPEGSGGTPTQVQRVRILPPLPALRTLSTTISHFIEDSEEDIREDFERGWGEGLLQLSAVRGRLRTSYHNGMRVVRFSEDGEVSEEGFDGLEDLENGESEFKVERMGEGDCPVLCVAGPGRKGKHAEGCGHAVAWSVWEDEL